MLNPEVKVRASNEHERKHGKCAKCSKSLVNGLDDLIVIFRESLFCSFTCLPKIAQ
jgi:hypothetical protein